METVPPYGKLPPELSSTEQPMTCASRRQYRAADDAVQRNRTAERTDGAEADGART
ncbi:hypothetical protein ACFVG1_24985 [Streptomyces bacillaris]|uniref:hypothetical protein n=1 Tax=Streptomyces bacillaris TaxID=68179 RepID=UPI0035D68DAA